MADVRRRLAAILFTDIVHHAALMVGMKERADLWMSLERRIACADS